MISIDITVLFHIINMLVLMTVLNRILYKPILSVIDRRQEKKDALTGEAEHFARHAHERQIELERKMREASSKAKSALERARNEAEADGTEKMAVIRQEAEREKEQQLAEIRDSIAAVRQELLADINGVAQDMAIKLLGRKLKA
jgi:F-type H+-transporting ATPase subunit b